jgi:hypothetical protein
MKDYNKIKYWPDRDPQLKSVTEYYFESTALLQLSYLKYDIQYHINKYYNSFNKKFLDLSKELIESNDNDNLIILYHLIENYNHETN